SDIDTAEVDSLKALDPNRPIREADIKKRAAEGVSPSATAFGGKADIPRACLDPFRKSGTRAAMRNGKSYGVCRPQQRMERIAIERVPAAWKCSTENRPYGGEAQVVSSAGRPLSKFMRHPRAQPQDYVQLWKLERHGGSWSDARRSRPNNSSRISRQRLAER